MNTVTAGERPWLRFYGLPQSLEYPQVTLYAGSP
jgi:hypothetical protein